MLGRKTVRKEIEFCNIKDTKLAMQPFIPNAIAFYSISYLIDADITSIYMIRFLTADKNLQQRGIAILPFKKPIKEKGVYIVHLCPSLVVVKI